MEKNLVIIVSFIFIVLLIFAIVHFGFKFVFKSGGINPPLKTGLPPQEYKKKPDSSEEYRSIIEKSKDEYRNFMEKTRSP